MIVGLLALLTLLLGGGQEYDYFLVDKMQKGVKEYVIDKERKKEILLELKSAESSIKAFNKFRKGQFKEFSSMFSDMSTEKESLINFNKKILNKREAFIATVASKRVDITQKINDEEWEGILKVSILEVEKRQAKTQKKIDKNKDKILFEKAKNTIIKNIPDNDKQKQILLGLDDLVKDLTLVKDQINSTNAKDSKVIQNKNATQEELLQVSKEMIGLRKSGFDQLLKFRDTLKNNSTLEQSEKIMKAFNTDFAMTNR